MNVAYINPFIEATRNVFHSMMQTDARPGKPALLENTADGMEFDISGIMGLSGETLGAVVISFPKMSALRTVSKLTGSEVKIFDQMVVDAIGEIINIIAGNAKKDLSQFKLTISLPSVVTGRGHRLNWPSGVPVITIPFTSELGDFSLSVSLRDT